MVPPALLLLAFVAADPLAGGIGMLRNFSGVTVKSVIADRSGAVTIAGETTRALLPVTPDAVQADYLYSTCGVQIGPGFPNPILCPNVYVAKVGADGELLHGSYFGATGGTTLGGAAFDEAGELWLLTTSGRQTTIIRPSARGAIPIALPEEKTAGALTVDAAGNLYIGATDTFETEVVKLSGSGERVWTARMAGPLRDLKVDGEGRVYVCVSERGADEFQMGTRVAMLGGDGRLAASIAFGGESRDDARFLALAPDGVLVAGTTLSDRFPVTARAAQQTKIAMTTGFVVKLARDLSAVVYATYLGGESWDWLTGLATLPDGSAVVVGSTASRLFPVTPDAQERCHRGLSMTLTAGFVSHLSASGDRLLYSSYFNMGEFASGVTGVAVSGGRAVVVAENQFAYDLSYYGGPSANAAASLLVRLDPERAPPRQRFCVVNAANFASGVVAPGQLVTLFGTAIGGGRVLVNGAPAEILYADEGQINAILPAELRAARVAVEIGGVERESETLRVAESAPGLFRDAGLATAAAVNEDGSRNSRERPARRGSVLTLYGTGFGAPRVRVYLGPDEAQVVSQRQAEGFPRGVTALEVRVPGGPAGLQAVQVNYSLGVEFALGNVRVWID